LIKKLYTKESDDLVGKGSESETFTPGLTSEQASLKEAIKRREQVTNSFITSTWQRWI